MVFHFNLSKNPEQRGLPMEGNMWKCGQCGEELEDQFDSCWKCSSPPQPAKPVQATRGRSALRCLRCQKHMDYYGAKRFFEGGHLSAFMGDLFVNREEFDVYICPACGHVEFFAELPKEEEVGPV